MAGGWIGYQAETGGGGKEHTHNFKFQWLFPLDKKSRSVQEFRY